MAQAVAKAWGQDGGCLVHQSIFSIRLIDNLTVTQFKNTSKLFTCVGGKEPRSGSVEFDCRYFLCSPTKHDVRLFATDFPEMICLHEIQHKGVRSMKYT